MTTLFIGNLDPRATVADVERAFSRSGKIKDAWVAKKPPGFAFVEFEDAKDADAAILDMNGRWILNRQIRVEISKRLLFPPYYFDTL